MNTGRLLLCALFLFFTQTLSAADDSLPATLRIGTSAGYPPLTFKEQGQLVGLEIDLAKAVGNQLGVRTELVEVPFEGLIEALNGGRIDVIMSGLSVTEARSRQVLFTDPYMETGQMGLIRTADLVAWSQPQTLLAKGRRIGVKTGTTGAAFAKNDLPNAEVIEFDTIEAGTEALSAKQIDIFIHDAPTIWRLTANYSTGKEGLMGLYRPLTDESLAWAVRRQDGQLATRLNRALEAISRNGTLNNIKGKWIPVQVKVRK